MTVEKKNPNAVSVSAANNVITAINDRHNATETAAFGHSSFALVGTSDTLDSDEFWDGAVITLTGSPSGDFTLTVPAEKRGIVTFINTTSVEVTIQTSGQTTPTPPTLPPKSGTTDDTGQAAKIQVDGSNADWANKPHFAMTTAEYAALSTVDTRAVYYEV